MRLLLADETQKRARDGVTFASWGTGLTADQYSAREQRLRLHPWAQSSMNSWLLCGDGHEVLSSCETFRMSSWSRGRKGWTQAVASVFTEPPLRGRGYSSVLIEMLMRELARREMDLQASILFSDVGPSLYERAGFEPLSASDWIFPVEAGPASKRVPRQGALPMLRAFQPEVRARDWTFIPRAIWV